MIVDNNNHDEEFLMPQNKNKKKKKVDFINQRIVSALDAAQVSDYKAMHIIAAIVEALGHNLDNLNVSRKTLSDHRKKHRKTIANEIKDNFSVRIEDNFSVFHY